MALAEYKSGTTAALTIDAPVVISANPETADGHYQPIIDLTNMQAGDTTEIRIYRRVLSAGPFVISILDTLNDAQADPAWEGPFQGFIHDWYVEITQTGGTGRAYPYSILSA